MRPMSGGKSVKHAGVKMSEQFLNKYRMRRCFRGELHVLLSCKPEVIKKQDLARLQRINFVDRGWPENVIRKLDLLSEDLGERFGVLLHWDVVPPAHASLMRSDHHPCFGEVSDGNCRFLDAVELHKLAGRGVNGCVHVDAQEDDLAIKGQVLNCQHGCADCSLSHAPIIILSFYS